MTMEQAVRDLLMKEYRALNKRLLILGDVAGEALAYLPTRQECLSDDACQKIIDDLKSAICSYEPYKEAFEERIREFVGWIEENAIKGQEKQ